MRVEVGDKLFLVPLGWRNVSGYSLPLVLGVFEIQPQFHELYAIGRGEWTWSYSDELLHTTVDNIWIIDTIELPFVIHHCVVLFWKIEVIHFPRYGNGKLS